VSLAVLAPVGGRALAMTAVPDPVFAGLMVGPGAAIDPVREPGTAVAPVAGVIVKLHPHAYVVEGEGGAGILVHLGIDTVQLKGEGFEVLATEGDQVDAGAPVVRWDPTAVEAGGRSPVCPIVALDASPDELADVVEDGDLAVGAPLFSWQR
jgi:sugar PTS system EIIA component